MILTLILTIVFCLGFVSTDQVPPPRNLRIKSENLGLILEWDPPDTSPGEDLKYTAEYKSWFAFTHVCANTSSPSCDLTENVTIFGTYKLRVRTELNGKSSNWMEIECKPLETITVIGAPNVRLQSRNGKMEVDITDPVLRKSSLKEVYAHIFYNIQYWAKGEMQQEKLVDQSRVILMELQPETLYCVKVEINLEYNKTSLQSNITCEMNTASDEVKTWLIFVMLLVSCLGTLISVLLIFVTVWGSYRGIRFLRPKGKLPEHFKQYLLERPASSILLAMQNNAPPRETYHEFSIITSQEAPPESTQKENSKSTQWLNGDMKDFCS